MKKNLTIILIALVAIPVIYLNLPFTFKHREDIKYGSRLVENLDKFYKDNQRLPDNTEHHIFDSLGFQLDNTGHLPDYEKLNDSTYQIIFIKGFDPPYLYYKSDEKVWKYGFP